MLSVVSVVVCRRHHVVILVCSFIFHYILIWSEREHKEFGCNGRLVFFLHLEEFFNLSFNKNILDIKNFDINFYFCKSHHKYLAKHTVALKLDRKNRERSNDRHKKRIFFTVMCWWIKHQRQLTSVLIDSNQAYDKVRREERCWQSLTDNHQLFF